MLVPRPIGNREAVMLVPFQQLVADDARALAADDKIGRARSMPMLFRVLARPEQLNPAAERPERTTAGHWIHVFQRHAVVGTAWLIGQRAQLRLDVLPSITQRQIFLLGVFPSRPHGASALLQVLAGLFPHSLNLVSRIGLVKRLVQAEQKGYIEGVHPDRAFIG